MADENTPTKNAGQGGYGATPYPQGGYPPPQGGAAPYPQGGASGYPQGGAPDGYPQGGAPAGYLQGGATAGYAQGGAPAGYPQGEAPAGYAQGGAPAGYPQGAPTGAVLPGRSLPQFQGEMTEEDVSDDPMLQASDMDVVAGYENIGFNTACLPPPSYDEATRGEPPERREFRNAPSITEEEAREALLLHVGEHCCFGNGPALQMVFRDLKSSSAFHYTLETFAESRTMSWGYEPYEGQVIDGPERGPAPGPWDIQAPAPTMFEPSWHNVEVPHTASVKPCHNCFGRGYQRCSRCHGRGRMSCDTCHGSGRQRVYEHGRPYHRYCHWCEGSGRRRCHSCDGDGQVVCSVCMARGKVKRFINLTIEWETHEKDYIVERTALPDELIRSVSGQVAFEEQNTRVWPINHFPDQEVNTASKSIVEEHARAFPNEKILMQRHHVRMVPVTQVFYSYKDQENASFIVYGFEHKVHAPDYPAQYCWGCVIL